MAPMTWKNGEERMVTCKCVRMHVIVEEKMSLSRVEVSQYQSIIDSIMCDGKVYRKTLHKGKKETSMRLDDGVIMRPWSEYKGYHHIKGLWTLNKLSC